MHGDDVTAGGGCGAHCAVRQGSSGSADSATGKFWGSREQSGAGRRLGGGVEWACRRAESANTVSIALQGMGQRLVAVSALLVQAVFEQMGPLIFGSEACCDTGTAGPVRMYSCTTTTARGYTFSRSILPVQLDPYGCTAVLLRLHEDTSSRSIQPHSLTRAS
jgi:hypothetical protein